MTERVRAIPPTSRMILDRAFAQKGSSMKAIDLGLCLALVVASYPASLSAAPQCGKRDAVLSALATKFGETRRGLGLAANSGVVEVFASQKTGSWTITITMADGMTCLVASGENYEQMTEEMPAKGDPA